MLYKGVTPSLLEVWIDAPISHHLDPHFPNFPLISGPIDYTNKNELGKYYKNLKGGKVAGLKCWRFINIVYYYSMNISQEYPPHCIPHLSQVLPSYQILNYPSIVTTPPQKKVIRQSKKAIPSKSGKKPKQVHNHFH